MTEPGFATRVMYNSRELVRAAAPRIRALSVAVGRPGDLLPSQAAHWFAVAVDFHPDTVIELGRLDGNSTAIFTEAANRVGNMVVKSFDLNDGWRRRRAVAQVVGGEEWFRPLELYSSDITREDFGPHVRNSRRVLLLWDAHGFAVGDAVLGRLMPLLAEKEHIVVCHDISDNRVCGAPRSYEGRPFWRGMSDYYEHIRNAERARVNLFWVNTVVDQAIPILDFCWRNGIELHSADYDYLQATTTHPDMVRAIRETWPLDLFQECNHWAYFSLNDRRGEYHFPKPAPVSGRVACATRSPELEPAAELRAVYSSLSWKLTAPLRTAGRLLRLR
jgi:hypothetical protein